MHDEQRPSSHPPAPPPERGSLRAIALAVLVHAALFAFLWIGIRWASETPVAVEAELWDLQARDAPPRVAPPELKPVTPPEPVPVVKPRMDPTPPQEKPDIALEQERKKKEKAQQEEAARKQRLAKEEEEKKAKARELAQLEQKQKEEQKKKEEAEKRRKAQAAQEARLLEQIRHEDMKRITAGASGSGGSGTAAKSQGMRGDAGYAGKVAAKIKANTAYAVPPDLQGNPQVEYAVQLFPDGSLRGTPRKVKSSGIPAFDEAVLRAIQLSAPFPADKSGAVPSALSVIQQPKEKEQ